MTARCHCGNTVAVDAALAEARNEAWALRVRVAHLSKRFRQGGGLGVSDTCDDGADLIDAALGEPQ